MIMKNNDNETFSVHMTSYELLISPIKCFGKRRKINGELGVYNIIIFSFIVKI